MTTTISQATAASLKERVREPGYQLKTSPTTLAISGVNARTAALTVGTYFLKADVDGYAVQGGAAVTATTFSWPVLAFEEQGPFLVTGLADGYFAAITTGASGTLFVKSTEEQ